MSDAEGNQRFYAVVWPHAAELARTARFLIRDAAEADDVVQEALLKAHRSLGSFRDGTDARAWLMTILRNARIDHVRRRAHAAADVSLAALPAEPADPACPDPIDEWLADADDPDALLQQFSDRHLIDALQRLPEEIRWTLLLVDVNGMDHADAARVMGVPVGTVKSRASRGRAMLRGELAPMAKELRLARGAKPAK